MIQTILSLTFPPIRCSGGGADPDLGAVGDRDLRAVPRAVGRRLLPHRTRPRVQEGRRRRHHLRPRTGKASHKIFKLVLNFCILKFRPNRPFLRVCLLFKFRGVGKQSTRTRTRSDSIVFENLDET